MLADKRQVMAATERVAAFVKRLELCAMQLKAPHLSLAYMSLALRLLKGCPKSQALLDNEISGSGVYRPDVGDPNLSNPFAANAWELALLEQHFHPAVAGFSRCLSKEIAAPSEMQLLLAKPGTLMQLYSPDQGTFRPPIKDKKVKLHQARRDKALAENPEPSAVLPPVLDTKGHYNPYTGMNFVEREAAPDLFAELFAQ